MRFELRGDGKVFGSFELEGTTVSDKTGLCEGLPESFILLDGEFERPASNEDDVLQFVADMFWSLEIVAVAEEPVEKSGTSEGACLGHQRQGHTLRSCVGAELVRSVVQDRAKIGHPKYNYSIGNRGEQIAQQLYRHYDAHGTWNDAHDMGNDELFEIKTIAGETTPILPRARERKLDMIESTGKDMKVILLKVEAKGIRVYEHTPMPAFFDAPQETVYVVSTQDSQEIGFINLRGDFTTVTQ